MIIEIEKLTTRRANMEDADDLLRWKNEEETRKNSIVFHGLIEKENHLKWLQKHLNDENTELYVITDGLEKFGDVRFDILPDAIEVGIRIDKHFRNCGIASRTIKTMCEEVQARHKKDLIAKIVDGNIPSMRVFLKNGFKMTAYVKPTEQGYYFLGRTFEDWSYEHESQRC